MIWRDDRATMMDIVVAAVVPGADENVLEENEQMAM